VKHRRSIGPDTTEHSMVKRAPRVSIGMPVYNGEEALPKALDALLNQTFSDFEIVICDNASTDRTEEICRLYVSRDKRIRYYRNETNIGQIANFNRVFELSTGEYFRWAGCNDWWAPEYVERCVEALDANPSAILVTCYQEHFDGDGKRFYAEYKGKRVDSLKPHRRFCRMLWFLGASRYYLDPIYSMMRRSALLRTRLLRPMLHTDRVLAAELSLIGPFCHVPECLAARRISAEVPLAEQARQFKVPIGGDKWVHMRRSWVMAADVMASPLTGAQKLYCLLALAKFHADGQARLLYRRLRGLAGRCLRYVLGTRSGWPGKDRSPIIPTNHQEASR